MDWKKLVGDIAPALGAALAGPFGGVAGIAIKKALDLPGDASDADLASAMQNPDVELKLKQAQYDFETKMEQHAIERESWDVKREEIAIQDKDSARKMFTETRDPTPRQLTIAISMMGILMSMGVGILFYAGKMTGLDAMSASILTLIVREIFAQMNQVSNFYFGSSSSSKAKDDFIHAAMVKK